MYNDYNGYGMNGMGGFVVDAYGNPVQPQGQGFVGGNISEADLYTDPNLGYFGGMNGMGGMGAGYLPQQPQGVPNGETVVGGISPTQQSIKNYLGMVTNCFSMETVDEFETLRTRHICPGSRVIQILSRSYVPVPTTRGMINADIMLCPMCRKLIINKSHMLI